MTDNRMDLSTIRHMTRDEMERQLIEQLADKNDAQIQSDLLYDLVSKNVELNLQLKEKIAEVERLSNTDPLTGLYNRLYFNSVFERELSNLRRYGRAFSLILFDIDHFKNVNDTYGHNAGDQVLRTIAAISKDLVRDSDVVARWGGEEFIVLLTGDGVSEPQALAERLRVAIESGGYGDVGRVTGSFGTTVITAEDTLVSSTGRADAALYRAKQSGRNRVCEG